MKLWKYHTPTGTVSSVEGEPWPGRDENGDVCYENRHFETEGEAWGRMATDAKAGVSLAGSAVTRAREMLRDAEVQAASACADYALVRTNLRQAGQVII